MKPAAQTIIPWLRANLGQRSLAPLAGSDREALFAAVSIVALMGYGCRSQDLHLAFLACVKRMQEQTRHLAYHAIAHVLDWDDRSAIWTSCGLPIPTTRCANEPSMRHLPA